MLVSKSEKQRIRCFDNGNPLGRSGNWRIAKEQNTASNGNAELVVIVLLWVSTSANS